MKDGERQKMEIKDRSRCSIINITFPTEMTCPICGYEVEIWTDQDETGCYICGYRIFQKENIIH
jgi:DNA-directed RNA polymerase subunit RPC12/RpoP